MKDIQITSEYEMLSLEADKDRKGEVRLGQASTASNSHQTYIVASKTLTEVTYDIMDLNSSR